MKRMRYLILFVLSFFLIAAEVQARIAPTTSWRWRHDDGTEETATWATDEERQSAELVGPEEVIRLRAQHAEAFDCGALKIKAAGGESFVAYSDFFAFADSSFLLAGGAVRQRLSIPYKPDGSSPGLSYHAGGSIVESPRLLPVAPAGTYQEVELCLKVREGGGIPQGLYTFELPDGKHTEVPLVYTHARAATVSTLSPTGIAATSATGRGDITDLGVRHPVRHGLCWSTTEDPDITCPKTAGGEVTETGAFAHPMTGLAPGTTYYVRAFATNSAGPAYGEQVRFTTLSVPDLEEPRVVSCNISENAWDIALNITPGVIFSESMDPNSLTVASLGLTAGGAKVPFRHVYVEATRSLVVLPEAPLPADTQVTLTVTTAACDRTGNSLYESFLCHFTTANPGPDQDSDGVPDSLEKFPGDSSRATVATVTNTGHFTLDASALEGGAELADVRTLSEYDPSLGTPGKPRDAEFPDGILAYKVTHVEKGGSVEVPVGIPSGLSKGVRVYKVTGTGYVEVTDRCRMEGDTLYVTLTDGGAGDADGRADGIIDDPLAVAVPISSPSVDTDSMGGTDEGGPCFVRSAAWR
ncbi:Ig-like domain-containing protein [Desulfoluna spongiiphila]|uniref:Ig-like domain-containing protein n=1 Tax=Desulfoluna spongiiphila TaxID=419481 RepID=A0A1G5BRK1_9BACT|nr:Ig-like domain-containing protein [Desulfoluna spongiiphila]SCX92855.1 Ig-like domain-containing protein [Desulfoluna spongiiphila]